MINLQDIINLLPPIDGDELKRYVESLQDENALLKAMLRQGGTDTKPSVACVMCDRWQPPRKAVTSVHDIPVCEQCAKEYQDAEDTLGNEDSV